MKAFVNWIDDSTEGHMIRHLDLVDAILHFDLGIPRSRKQRLLSSRHKLLAGGEISEECFQKTVLKFASPSKQMMTSLSLNALSLTRIDGLFGLGDWVDLSPTKYRRHLP